MSDTSIEHLPTYTEARAAGATPPRNPTSELPTVHTFHLVKASGHRWLTLSIRSNASTSTAEAYFFGGDTIAGSVELDLHNPERICSIQLSVTGRLIWDTARRIPLLKVSQTVYSAQDNSSSPPPTLLRHLRRPSSSLSGNHVYPFSIHIPPVTNLLSETFALPASFEEMGTNHTVTYSLSLEVTRRSFSASSWILQPFTYVPAIRPPAAITSNQTGGDTFDPEIEPSEWNQLSPVTITGKLFSTRQISVKAILSLANPLVYTRGTIIPLYVTLFSKDTQALDLLASSKALNVELVLVSKSERATDMRVVQRAVWFPHASTTGASAGNEAGPNIRRLKGEIYLSTSLKPGITLPTWSLSYAVALFSFDAPGFVSSPALDQDTPLVAKQVEIATMHSRGGSVSALLIPQGEVRCDPWQSWRHGAGKDLAMLLKL